jgi:predicted nucleic acid-binding protein
LNGAVYFDSAYVAKCYLSEPDSYLVREFSRSCEGVTSSALCIAEVSCAVHRKIREESLSPANAMTLRRLFLDHVEASVWLLIPVSERILRRAETLTRMLPGTVLLRALDAIHLASAIEEGFREIWTNDRRLLTAAEHFGIKGRQITPAA